jgi:RNA-binding protein
MALSPKTRRALIAEAHSLHPIVMIGQKGLTKAIQLETDQALNDHELIKIRISAADKEDRVSMATELSQAVQAECLKIIGHIAIFYRKNQ